MSCDSDMKTDIYTTHLTKTEMNPNGSKGHDAQCDFVKTQTVPGQ